MSSLIRRMERNLHRPGYKGTLGMKVGQHNPTAADLLARNARFSRRKERASRIAPIDEKKLLMLHPPVPNNGMVDPKADRSLNGR